ncbi:MAG: IS1096 element passenger TnpR family protein [Anaerolineae bacterium]
MSGVLPERYENWSVEALVGELQRCAQKPSPDLLEALRNREQAAPALMALLKQPSDILQEAMAQRWAVLLLSDYGEAEAIVPIVATLTASEYQELAMACGEALLRLGPEALEQVLPIIADMNMRPLARAEAVRVAWQLALRAEPSRSGEVISTYRSSLQQALEADAPEEVVTRLVEGLVNLRDVDSWPLISQAFNANRVDERLIGRSSARSRIKSKNRPRMDSLSDWLASYRSQLRAQEHFERLIREDPVMRTWVREHFPDVAKAMGIEGDEGEEDEELPPRLALKDKDKCWCGSGRAYRFCHKQSDEYGETAPPLETATPPTTLITYTFKVQPTWVKGVWRTLELTGYHTLHALHGAIQGAFDWDNDHLYSFYMSNKVYDSDSEYSGTPVPGIMDYTLDAPMAYDIRLDELNLSKGRKFKYLFDFGDSNVFQVTVTAVNKNAPAEDYPLLLEEHGDAPEQYPYAEDEWDEEDDEQEKQE